MNAFFSFSLEAAKNIVAVIFISVLHALLFPFTAGCLAQRMGLPITLVAGVNTNNIVARTLDGGDFSVKGSVITSLAPAMDIQVIQCCEACSVLCLTQSK